MSASPLKRLFGLAKLLFNLAFVVGILEVVGMMVYLGVTEQQAAFDRLRDAGFTPSNVVEFLLASPDRTAVAVGLALLGALLVVSGSSTGRHRHADGIGAVDFGGDGDGGGGGGDGGGGGGE